jgi:hypothetical protein
MVEPPCFCVLRAPMTVSLVHYLQWQTHNFSRLAFVPRCWLKSPQVLSVVVSIEPYSRNELKMLGDELTPR